MKKSDRLSYNFLSKDLYGTSSKWQKMLKGIPVDLKREDGVITVLEYFTEDEVIDIMIEERQEKNEDR